MLINFNSCYNLHTSQNIPLCIGAASLHGVKVDKPPIPKGFYFMENEIWKDIQGYEDIYQISNFGRVKRLEGLISNQHGTKTKWKERLLKNASNTRNYKFVELSLLNVKKTFLIHRLVSTAFHYNPDNKRFVNHKDGDPSNNHYLNLEWATVSENELHKIHVLNIKPTISNFKFIEQTDNIIRINHKNIYGKELQKLLLRFLKGEVICPKGFSSLEVSRFYGQIYELRKRFDVPILSTRRRGLPSYKDYFLDPNGKYIESDIKHDTLPGGFREFYLDITPTQLKK